MIKVLLRANLILLCMTLMLLSMSGACADEGNFTQLNDDLSLNDNLTKDYIKTPFEDSINLSESKNIDGNGHLIESNDIIEFRIKDNSTYQFNNVAFRCDRIVFTIENFTESSNITFINCSFHTPSVRESVEAHIYGHDWGYGKSCKVLSKIKKMAFKIIGDSKDLEAAKKLAVWVTKNVKYEKRAGFYQSPSKTLKRHLGNCCCKSDLLLQMMDAVGLCKNHKICYVHVGNNHYHHRHYFLTLTTCAWILP